MSEIDALLREDRTFDPSPEFRARATVNDPEVYARAAANPEAFWEGFARELEWIEPWSQVLDWQPPHAKWFVGGKLNVSANCLDRHVRTWRRNKAAIIWEGEPGDRRTLTYFDLYREVCKLANVLKGLGVRKGDRVAIYMPLDAGAGHRHAGLRADRRRPLGGLRRLLRRVAARSDQRRAGAGC